MNQFTNEYLVIAMRTKGMKLHDIADILGISILKIKAILTVELTDINFESKTVRQRGGCIKQTINQ